VKRCACEEKRGYRERRKMKSNESSFKFHKVTDRVRKTHFKVC